MINGGDTINELFTVQEVADKLKIHVQTVRKWIKEGKIKALKLGSDWRVTEQSISEFLKSNEAGK